jgi:hypothetical protein
MIILLRLLTSQPTNQHTIGCQKIQIGKTQKKHLFSFRIGTGNGNGQSLEYFLKPGVSVSKSDPHLCKISIITFDTAGSSCTL